MRKGFDIGKMRHRARIKSVSRTDDGCGGTTRADTEADILAACFEPVRASERVWGGQFTQVITHQCWLRYNELIASGVTIERVISSTRTISYYVVAVVNPDEQQRFMKLMLREGGPL